MGNYGTGSITFEGGKWRVRVSDGTGQKITIGRYATEVEAKQMRDAALLARLDMPIGMTLRRFGDEWLRQVSGLKSIRGIESTWRSILLDAPFVDQPISSVTRADVEQWANELPKKPKKRSVLKNGKRKTIELDAPISRKTAMNAIGYLQLCLTAARKAGHCKENVAEDVDVPRDRNRIEEPAEYLSAEEVEQLLACPDMPLEQRVVFTIATHQGLRQGEIAGMDWDRVDWKGNGWWIAKSWNGSTKNGKTRWQALLPRAEAALREWWEAKGRPTSGIVFPSPQLGPLDQSARYARGHDWGWADIPEGHVTRFGWWRRAGLRTRIRFHDLRDTAATHLLSGTWGFAWRIEDVSRHLGHSSIAITEARYAHTTKESLRRSAQATGPKRAQTCAQRESTQPGQLLEITGSGGRARTYDQSVNSRSLYH